MEYVDDNKQGSPKIAQERQDGNFDDIAGIVGIVPHASAKVRNDQIRTVGRDSQEPFIYRTSRGEATVGGIFSQLIKDAEEELAWFKDKVEKLESRIEYLKGISREEL